MEPLIIGISLSVLVHFSLAFIIYAGAKNLSVRIFGIATFFSGLWVAWRGVFHFLPQEAARLATIMNDFSFATGVIIACLWVYFTLVFPENTPPKKWVVPFLFFINLLLLPIYLFKDLFLGNATWVGGINHWIWEQGPFLFVYDIFITPLWLAGFIILWLKARRYEGKQRKELRVMFTALAIALAPVQIASIILPRIFNNFSIEWTSSLTMIGWSMFLGYHILKHNQMNVKTVAAELLIIAATGLLFLNIFI